ncbi:MAG TPA: N-acetylmuramidase domain-containing protein [Noviherbaspirillum sp.]|nr:N-acetylmuramidase domain-containing protein [Noviherbaspirillum sp.]
MASPRFKTIGTSITTPIENTKRRELSVLCRKYSQTLDYSDFPDLWLPWKSAATVAVQCGPIAAGSIGIAADTDAINAFMTLQPQMLSYWHAVGPIWTVEQSIAVADQLCVNGQKGNDEIGNDDIVAPSIPDPIADPYLVQPGDTLSAIAKRAGKTVVDLQRLNGLANPDRLQPDQTLYLSEASAYGVSVLFLDALRHPIENLPYKLIADRKTMQGKTDATGTIPRHTTRDARSGIELLVQDAQGQWQSLVKTASGYGYKLITLVSGALVFPGQTEPHPKNAPRTQPLPRKAAGTKSNVQAPPPMPPQGVPIKNNPAVKTKKTKGPQGQHVLKIEIDIPQGLLDLFTNYTGAEITEADWEKTAKYLECETAVLKAFAEVESGGRSSFWRLNEGGGAQIPAILYERHYFSDLTKGKYDKAHPDLSWPTGYRKKEHLGESDKNMFSGKVETGDIYSDYASAYLRLINAFRLDTAAALKSCSWGKFQIMGQNFSLCGTRNVNTFVERMCTSEFDQIKLLAEFIRNKPSAWKNRKNKALGKEISLWDAVKSKHWAAIAFNYNGPGYKTYDYDVKLKKAYEKHLTKHT